MLINKNKLQTGDLLAWRNDGTWLANVVSYMTKGEYTHVGLVWTLHNRPYVLDAFWKGGVRLRHLADNLPVDVIKTNVKWSSKVEDDALSKLGRSYNIMAAAMLGIDITPNYDSEVCSLYAAKILRECGMNIPKIPLTPQKLVDNVTIICNNTPITINSLKGLHYE